MTEGMLRRAPQKQVLVNISLELVPKDVVVKVTSVGMGGNSLNNLLSSIVLCLSIINN